MNNPAVLKLFLNHGVSHFFFEKEGVILETAGCLPSYNGSFSHRQARALINTAMARLLCWQGGAYVDVF